MLKIQPAAARDRRVRFEKKSVTRDPDFNSEVVTWVPADAPSEVWASVLDALQSSSEASVPGLRLATGQTKVECMFRTDIDRTMRIVLLDRTRILQIVDIAEIGRKGGLQLACEEFSA
jgi:head-tail adaptor